ncbi:hypothetical protein [Ekhidna sp.]
MEIARNLIFDDYYKLRITSKKLKSGRYQVKFFATVKGNKQLYGYVLVEAEETLKAVIGRIRRRLQELEQAVSHKNLHLCNINQTSHPNNLMIFR